MAVNAATFGQGVLTLSSRRGCSLRRPGGDRVHHALDDKVGGELVCPDAGGFAGVGDEDLAAADRAGEGGVATTPHLLVDVLLQAGLAQVVQAGQGLGVLEGIGTARARQELVLKPLGSSVLRHLPADLSSLVNFCGMQSTYTRLDYCRKCWRRKRQTDERTDGRTDVQTMRHRQRKTETDRDRDR